MTILFLLQNNERSEARLCQLNLNFVVILLQIIIKTSYKLLTKTQRYCCIITNHYKNPIRHRHINPSQKNDARKELNNQ